MSSKIEVNVSQYGDELLTAYVNGEYEAVIDMWSAVSNNENTQTMIAFHWYKNERIVDKTVCDAMVDCCQTLEAQGHPRFSRPAMTTDDEKKEVQQQWLDGLITQSEMSAKLKSLDSQ